MRSDAHAAEPPASGALRLALRELGWPLALFALALAVRLPYFTTIPAVTDETDELLWALRIRAEGFRPLSASDAYIGPLAGYLTALAYALVGPSLASARWVALLLGAAAAPATWLLGRCAAGPGRTGPVAGLLVALAFGPILISHIAWSHGAAPAWLALALALGIDVVRRGPSARRRWGFGLAGLAFGLGLSAHPTVLAFAPGAMLVAGRRLRRSSGQESRGSRNGAGQVRRPSVLADLGALALGLLLSLLPGLLGVLREGIDPLRSAAVDRDYVGFDLGAWPAGVLAWLDSLARNLLGPAAADLGDPRAWLAAACLGYGLWVTWRAGARWPVAVVASGALCMPLLVSPDKFLSLTGLRYAAPALPAATVALAMATQARPRPADREAGAVAQASDVSEASQVAAPRSTTHPRSRVSAAIPVLLMAVSLVSLAAFYRSTATAGVTGEPVLAVVATLAADSEARDMLFLDEAFDTKLVGGGEVGRAVGALLVLEDIPFTPARVDKMRWYLANGDGARFDLVLSGESAAALSSEFALVPVRVVALRPGQVSRSGDYWGLYRFQSARAPDDPP